jgi:GH25 family lysozyme M1 (1,4-beta-N-acetylmuramidase)
MNNYITHRVDVFNPKGKVIYSSTASHIDITKKQTIIDFNKVDQPEVFRTVTEIDHIDLQANIILIYYLGGAIIAIYQNI